METRICTHCKKELPLSNFIHHKSMPGGYTGYCKACYAKRTEQLKAQRIVKLKHERAMQEKDPLYCDVFDLIRLGERRAKEVYGR